LVSFAASRLGLGACETPPLLGAVADYRRGDSCSAGAFVTSEAAVSTVPTNSRFLAMEPLGMTKASLGRQDQSPDMSRCQASWYWLYLDLVRCGERTITGWLLVARMGRMYQVSTGMTKAALKTS
jgi:hypothetical protein